MKIPSVWDNWQRQCTHSYTSEFLTSVLPKAYCAIGWLLYGPGDARTESHKAIERVGNYLLRTVESDHADWLETLDAPLEDRCEAAVMFANDELRWTPAKFRKIDRMLQVEEAVRPLVDEPVEVEVEVS